MEDDPFQFFEVPFNDINEDNHNGLIEQENDSEDTLNIQSNEGNDVGTRNGTTHQHRGQSSKPFDNCLTNNKKDSNGSGY
ncbi:unnamed protein product [Haemonchus placei]|uniref:Uncharacterized protein n=1 Tax=Haemonchus placei TaxID=6290 RepID=A0A0N4W1T5_HAEPC|nr:unnamed protein product [Haemonchus placei]